MPSIRCSATCWLLATSAPAPSSTSIRITGLSTLKAGPFANSGLNALTFNSAGNAYVSDSFNGVIWKVPHSGPATTWSNDRLLGPGTGLTPPFGANGVEFNNDHSILYVANTAFHQIIQIPVNHDGTAGKASILITGINAPDGIAVDDKGNISVCANQQDEIDVIDKTGKVIAKRGDFRGIDQNGIAQGLLFQQTSPSAGTSRHSMSQT